MVSDEELVARLREFLRSSDLATTTTAIARRRLEEDFGVELSHKKAFIREQVDLFLQSELDLEPNKESDGANHEVEDNGDGDDGAEASGDEEEEEDGEEEGGDDGDEEEEEDEDRSNGGSSKKRRSNELNSEVKKRGGFTKLCSLSPQLETFFGVSELARTEVVKKLWAYIRENNLQDPSNRRKILCDEKLRTLFNVSTIDMFQMNKALAKHIYPLGSEDGPVKSTPKEKQQKKEKGEGSHELRKKDKRQKRASSGFLKPLPLSDAMVKFIGTGENELPRSDVVKRIWDYIKQNNLQDPADKRNIICDEKLKELFNVDSFTGFTVSKLLTAHFIKAEQ